MNDNAKRMSIAELERLLQSEEDVSLTIRPDGTIVRGDGKLPPRGPLTQQHYLGGEY